MYTTHPYVHYASRFSFSKGQVSGPRKGYSSAIHLIEQGAGILTMNDENKSLTPGTFIYIPAGAVHTWQAAEKDPMVHICCYFDWHYVDRRSFSDDPSAISFHLHDYLVEYEGPHFPIYISEYIKIDKINTWGQLFESFYTPNEFVDERSLMRNLIIQGNFQHFIHRFLSIALSSDHVMDPRINKLLDILEKDIATSHIQSISHYRQQFNLSRSYFHEIFKKTTGFTFTQYINHYKISQSKEDIKNSQLSINDIADKYQFQSVHYFSRLFKKVTGENPTQFRKRHQ